MHAHATRHGGRENLKIITHLRARGGRSEAGGFQSHLYHCAHCAINHHDALLQRGVQVRVDVALACKGEQLFRVAIRELADVDTKQAVVSSRRG